MDLKTFGENIRIIRFVLNMSATELGSCIGLTRQAINNYEAGRTIPKEVIRMALIGYLYRRNESEAFDSKTADILKKCFTTKVTITIYI